VANNTGWIGGRGQGLTWGSLFGTEVGTLASTDSVLSSVSVANGSTTLDQFMDVSLEATISSSTIAAGAAFTLWLMALMEDGTTYGDGSLTTTPSTAIPGLFPVATMPIRAAATTTNVYGYAQGIILPPGTFSMAINNGIGFNLATCTIKYRTYNQQLNGG
jgi:hypothetical protein